MPQTHIQTLPLRAPRGIIARLITAMTAASQRRAERHRLALLDDHMLRDIGLELQDAQRECSKPFWQP